MKRSKIFCTLALAIILSLLILALPTVPTHAITGIEYIVLYPTKGEIGDHIYIDGVDFELSVSVYIYFSSYEAYERDYIRNLDAYEEVRRASSDYDGYLETSFVVPDELTDGDYPEEVRGGDYYVYLSYTREGRIAAVDTFTIISGEITIDPEEGNVGDEVEISGEGFGDRESITVEYDGDDIDIESGDDETDRDGDFTCTILIPESTGGDHTITVTDTSHIEVEAVFTVEPKMTISSTSGSIGDTVSVSGTGFGYRKYVTIYFGGDEVDTSPSSLRTTTDGSFEATFAVPAMASGVYDVEIEDTADNSDAAEFTLIIIVADASITPTTGSVDTEVEVSGTGFVAGSTVTITYDALEIDTATVDSNGEFTCLIFIPESVEGDHTITVTDTSGIEAEAEFTVEPEMTISPTSGSIGDTVFISGTGFGYRKYVTICFGGDEVDTSPSSVRTDTDGSFDATFAVPGMASDVYDVDAEDADNNIATAQFTVAALFTLTTATSLDSPGHVGMELTMSGTGFIANHQVTITYLSEPFTFTTNTDANGTFSYKFDAPASTSGAHTITATDGINTLSKTFYMESTPPSTVYPLLPKMGGKLETGKFDWCGAATDPSKEVTDDSLPITYTLEIATDENFTNIVLKKEGLTTSEYTLTEAEKQLLPSTKKEAPYCWHVKAIDSAFNDTGWTGTGKFHVGFAFEMPDWAMYALFGILALLLAVFGFWVGRRTAYSSF